MDGIWDVSNFTGLHGTGHGVHGVYPNFTGLVCPGSGSKKKHPMGSGSHTFPRGSVWTRMGFSKFHGITGLFPIPWNPVVFSQREKSRGKPCTKEIAEIKRGPVTKKRTSYEPLLYVYNKCVTQQYQIRNKVAIRAIGSNGSCTIWRMPNLLQRCVC